MKIPVLIALFLAIPLYAYADSWTPQTPKTIASPQGEFLLRAIPPKRLDDQGKNWSKMIFVVYHLDEASQDYKEIRRFNVEGQPIEFLINDRGDRIVTLDQYFGIGQGPRVIAVYDGKGNELRTWSLKDFYDKNRIKDLAESTTSVFWRGDAGWVSDQNKVMLTKPTITSQNKGNFDDYLLDVRRLKISKYIYPNLNTK